MLREISIFLVIFAVLAALLAFVIHLLGGSFGINLPQSWSLSLIALVFFLPGMANVHIFAASKPTPLPERLLALTRAVGMFLAAMSCATPIFSTLHDGVLVVGGIVLGILMTLVTLPLEQLLRKK